MRGGQHTRPGRIASTPPGNGGRCGLSANHFGSAAKFPAPPWRPMGSPGQHRQSGPRDRNADRRLRTRGRKRGRLLPPGRGLANSPHVWVQQYLLPGTERTLSVALPNEAFRVRVLRVHATCPLEPDPHGRPEVTFTCRDDGWYPLRQEFSPGSVSVHLATRLPMWPSSSSSRCGGILAPSPRLR
jgi:hypothetical protein